MLVSSQNLNDHLLSSSLRTQTGALIWNALDELSEPGFEIVRHSRHRGNDESQNQLQLKPSRG
jgi:hypothetical protein